jgi:ATP-binding cassette subfamily G (WHITE) protein 2
MLRALSDTGRIVVAVLHQPRSAIYVQFDKLLLLAGGRTVYFGAASQARGYFRRLGYDCPEHFNTADYLLDVISIDTRTNEICQVTTQRVAYLTSSWSETGESMRVIFGKREGTKTATEHFATISLKSPVIGELTSPQPLTCIDQTRGWLRDFCLLLWRACAENVRNYGAFLIRFAMSAFTVVILSLVYQRLPHTQRSIQDRIGVLFFVTINQAFGPLIAIVAAIPTEKRIVLSERLSSSYSVTAYFLGRFLAELPALILLVGTVRTVALTHTTSLLSTNTYVRLVYSGVLLYSVLVQQSVRRGRQVLRLHGPRIPRLARLTCTGPIYFLILPER